jgi:hypothetical protein
MKSTQYEFVTVKVGGLTFWGNAKKRDQILNEYLNNGWELVDQNNRIVAVNGMGGSTTRSLTFRREK